MQQRSCDLGLPSRFLRIVTLCILLIACFVRSGFALNPGRSIGQYAHSAWRLQDGFIGAPPNAITQTVDGYIWIATTSGIVRFDGVQFTQWSPPGSEELRNFSASTVLGTTDGGLWIAGRGGLFRWKNERLTSYGDSGNSLFTAILEEGDGKVWVTRSNPETDPKPICEAGGEKLLCYDLKRDPSDQWCNALAKDSNGELRIGCMSFIRWNPRSLVTTEFNIPAARPNTLAVGSIASLPDGSFWVAVASPGPTGGLQHFAHDRFSSFRSSKWDSSRVGAQSVLFDRHGALWVGTVNHGLYRIWNGEVDHFGSGSGLSSDKVKSLFEDHEGNLWVTTQEGVDCFRDLAVAIYTSRQGLHAADFESVLAARDGTVWVGGHLSLDRLREGKVVSSATGVDLPGEEVTSLLQDSHGRMWVGIDLTLSILEGNKFTEVKRPDGSPLGMVVGLTEDSEGTIWAEVSARTRQLIQIRNSTVIKMFPEPAMPAARKVAVGTNGDLWLGLLDGRIARYHRGKVDTFQFNDKPASIVNDIGFEADGTVLGATGYGLVGLRGSQQRTLSARNGLPCDGISTFIRDDQRALWLDTQCGLIQIPAEEFKRWWDDPAIAPKFHLFTPVDGAQPGRVPFQKAARTPDGKLWFVNGAALQMIDPNHLPVNRVLPPVHVEEVVVADKSYWPGSPLHFASSTRDLSIRYTGLSFVAPQKVLFRYMLEGQDKTWQSAGTRRQAFYTNLRPRTYVFRVIACNDQGLWNEVGDSIVFTIAPAFYQTRWFQFASALALLAILWSLYLLRLNQVTLQIQGRLGARLEERERIARELHDTLLQGFQGLMLRFQAVMKTLPSDQPAHQMLDKVLDRADDLLFEGRQSVRDLREKGSSKSDLSSALLSCGDELAQGHSSRFSLTVVGTPRPVEPVVFDDAYRIAREALINAFQHSGASKIEAEITYSANGVWITVRDNGMGMDADILVQGRDGHWGLSGMRERARKIGAQLHLSSCSGAGTLVELKISAQVAYLGVEKQTPMTRVLLMVNRRSKNK